MLPIEEVALPTENVSDLKDVFEAINRLCDTMKTSNYVEPECEAEPEIVITKVEILHGRYACEDEPSPQDSLASSEISVNRESWRDIVSPMGTVKPEWKDSQVSLASSESVQREIQEERWSDTLTSPPSSDVSVTREARERWSDCRSPNDACSAQEPSEVYYTASSDVSLVSDETKGDKCVVAGHVVAGHVAAMRERFESMTRANTPGPDATLDVLRNVTPSPDPLG